MLDAIAKPFGVLLMLLYRLITDYGFAIIIFALIVRLIMTPFLMKSKRSQIQMARFQPRLKELEKKHGANKQKYQEEMMKLYKEEGISPMSGCLWGMIPIPIMLALYRAVIQPLTIMMGIAKELLQEGGAITTKLSELGFVAEGTANLQIAQAQFISDHYDKFSGISDKLYRINFNFFGINLGEKPQWDFLWKTDWSDVKIWLPGLVMFLIPIISGLAQFVSMRISNKLSPTVTPEGQGNTMQTMMLFMPLISVYFGFAFPAAIGIYWTAGTVFYAIQDIWLTKRYTRIVDAEEAVKAVERKKREDELEAKRIETERKKAENATERNRNTSKRKLQTTEREDHKLRAAEYNKKDEPEREKDDEPSRVGHRRYARGRAYDPHRYDNVGADAAEDEVSDLAADEEPEDTGAQVGEVDLSLPEVTVDDLFETDDDADEDDGEEDE